MTVADLIDELQRMPNKLAPVRVTLRRVWVPDMMGNLKPYDLCPGDEETVDEVRNEGAHVLIKGFE